MSLTSGNIPSLIQGVSQQSQTLRLPTQLEIQENCHSSAVEGLIRRPPTEYVAKISDSPMTNAYHHLINRDTTERYNVILSPTNIQVFDLMGDEKTVNFEDQTIRLFYDVVAVSNGATYTIAPAPGETKLDFTVSGLGTGTVKLQLSVDGTTWSDLDTRTTNGTTADITIGSNLYMRAIVSAWTSGSITASVTYQNLRYLQCTSPKSELKAFTIADFSFLLNTTKTTGMKEADADLSPTTVPEALFFVKAGQYSSTYSIYINGALAATYTTSTTSVATLATEAIAAQLVTALTANSYHTGAWSLARTGSTIYLKNVAGTDFTAVVTDSQGGDSFYLFKDHTESFTNLPLIAPNNFLIAIDANPETLSYKYYLKAVVDGGGFDQASWQETVTKGVLISIDPHTMPHALVREADGTFSYVALDWADRVVGDDDSNSVPSFIDAPIKDIFLYKNRLGFLSGEFFVFSESFEYFNFFRNTVTQLVDTDTVDSRAVNVKVSELEHAIPFNKDLIMFSDQTQFQMPGSVALTPKTVTCDPASEYEGNLLTKPINTGKAIEFIFDREGYAGLNELFFSESVESVLEVSDLTSHVPSYIPSGVFSLSNTTLEGIRVLLTDGDPSVIYVYKTAHSQDGRTRLQAAWYRWPMGDPETTIVLSAKFLKSTLYLLVQRDGKVYQEKMVLQPARVDEGSTYLTHLDRRIDETDLTVSYDIGTDTTSFDGLPYPPDADTIIVTKTGTILQIDSYDADTIIVNGAHDDDDVWIGQKYLSRVRLSQIFIRKQAFGGGLVVDQASNLQLLRGYLNFSNTGYFKISITPQGRDTSVYEYTGVVVGELEIGQAGIGSGKKSFAILAKNSQVEIEFSSDSFLPFALTSVEWEGNYTKRSR